MSSWLKYVGGAAVAAAVAVSALRLYQPRNVFEEGYAEFIKPHVQPNQKAIVLFGDPKT